MADRLPPEILKCYASLLKDVQRYAKRIRYWRMAHGSLAVLYPVLAASQTWYGTHWAQPVVNLLVGWLMYRLYLAGRRREIRWSECVHHAQRIVVETQPRALWHIDQLGEAVKRLRE